MASANQRVAHIMTKHVDEQQFMYAIQNEYMSGPLRSGFHNLLIAVHLQTHADARYTRTRIPGRKQREEFQMVCTTSLFFNPTGFGPL